MRGIGLALVLAVVITILYGVDGEIVLNIRAFRVRGQLACTRTGNVSPSGTSPPLVGARVSVFCNGSATTITDSAGFFNVTLNASNVNINFTPTTLTGFRLPNCFATVRLPVPGCLVLPANELLAAPLYFLGTVADNIFGVALRSVTGEFVPIPIMRG